jgi:hypothetical protein
MSLFRDIPLNFPDSTGGLKRDLERFANSVYAFGKDALQTFAPRIRPLAQTPNALSFDVAVPVTLVSGQTLTLALPRPDPKNGGRVCVLIRRNPLGILTVRAIDCRVDGFDQITVPAVGVTTFFFDGQDYWGSRG